MKIAQLAPLFECVPPKLYGGTERVVSCLTEELVRRGHDVTLFASADSNTSAKLVACSPRALRLNQSIRDPLPHLMAQVGQVFEMADEFDIVHCHVDYLAFPFTRMIKTPTAHTMHGRLDLPELSFVFEKYPDINRISISHSQRKPFPNANWTATVYNGIPMENYTFSPKTGDYLAFLGRISPEKGIDRAIKIAKKVGMKLRIAAKVDRVDQEYYDTLIKPLMRHRLIEYIGEVDEAQKDQFLGEAYATLFPIRWPEPFGLTMTESMACGTPVIAMRQGSVPEVIADGETGFICDSLKEMVAAVGKVTTIDRRRCRQHVEKYFSAQAMASAYLEAFAKILSAAAFTKGKARPRVEPMRPPASTSIIDAGGRDHYKEVPASILLDHSQQGLAAPS